MIVDVDRFGQFKLPEAFLAAYKDRLPAWGFGALSWVTFKRTYSRDGEHWYQTCRRVIEGMFTVQRIYCLERGLDWDDSKAQHFAADAYDRMWRFKWTPPGRGLWTMGSRFMYENGGAALNNCGFVSTGNLDVDYPGPFLWMLQMTMLGVGVGFDTRGKGKVTIARPGFSDQTHVIEDSREGWAGALKRLLGGYVGKASLPRRWDYSQIRPKGAPLKSFGGFASGPGPLQLMITDMTRLYDSYVGQAADSRLIVDTMNIVGRCVIAGGTRRSAQIAFGDPDDTQFLDLKQDRAKINEYRWLSNNSIFAEVGMDYSAPASRTIDNGEPGYLWLENARAFGRLADEPNWVDAPAMGSNPCVEQTLWDKELCCLVETFPAHHETLEDYKLTLRVAYQYAKTVTLVPTADAATNAVLGKNRRIGCSMTGIVQAIGRLGYRRFIQWCDQGYEYVQYLDRKYSNWLCVPRSIKTTSVKPSGTVSLLAGATPGVHWEHAPFYIRRVRVSDVHPLVDMCRLAGYPIEPDKNAADTMVISFPVRIPNLTRRKADVPLREKVDLAAQMQRYWSDNQVSCTAQFNPDTEADQIPEILSAYEDRLKAIVFLPAERHGYEQTPYEEISAATYERLTAGVKPLQGQLPHEHELEARYCEGGVCDVDPCQPPCSEG